MATALVAAVLGLGVAGCGGGDGSGATVSVYVAAPLCSGAKEELASRGATAGHYEVAVRCLAPSERVGGGSATAGGSGAAAGSAVTAGGRSGGRLDLAALGANSRRATEDTSAVATLEPPGSGTKFSRAILESAGVPLLTTSSAHQGMKRILEAVTAAGTSDVRDSVRESLEPN